MNEKRHPAYGVIGQHDRTRTVILDQPALKTPRFADTQIEMAHGAGGTASRRLVEGLIGPYFASPPEVVHFALPPATVQAGPLTGRS